MDFHACNVFFPAQCIYPTRSNLQSRESVDKGVDGCATAVCAHPRLRLAHPRLRCVCASPTAAFAIAHYCGLPCSDRLPKVIPCVVLPNPSVVITSLCVGGGSRTGIIPGLTPCVGAGSSTPYRAMIPRLRICTLALGCRGIFRDCGCASFALALPCCAFCLSLATVDPSLCLLSSLSSFVGTSGSGVVRKCT